MSKKSTQEKKSQEPATGSADKSEFEHARELASSASAAPADRARPAAADKPAKVRGMESPSASDESEFKYVQNRDAS